MGGIYGKLIIIAYGIFAATILGFIIMCIMFGRRDERASSQKINNKTSTFT